MMNLLQLQDRMKGMPDTALQTAANMPGEHQFLAMAELAERQRIRGAYANQAQQAQPTVAERIMGGNPVAPVESPRADIGGLAAASNRGDMQPALKMAQGGAVPSTYYMADGGKVPERVIVTAQQGQDQLDPYNRYNQVSGSGPYETGLIDAFRGNIGSLVDQFMLKSKEAAPPDRVSALLAAQDQDRIRNAEMEKRDKWLALAQAGLGMAAGNSSDFLTNVVGGAQAGLGALRQGMTEAEKRQAGLQARSDMLEKARMEQEAQRAQADRAALGLGFQANSGVELQGLRAAGDMTAADIQNAAAMDRTMAQNSAELQRAQISAATQRYTAQLNAGVQRAELAWRQRVDGLNRSDAEKARIGEGFGTITARVAAAFKVTDNPANAAMAANAWRADAKSFAARNGLPAEYASDQFNPFAEAAKAVSPSATAKGAMTREEFAKQYTAGPGGARAAADQSPQD
jgi:hypothetical protein